MCYRILSKSIYWVGGCGNGVCRLPFTRRPPAQLSLHPLPLFPHLGAHRIPPPHFCTPTPLACRAPHPGCASPRSHTLRVSTLCCPGCTTHRSVPPPLLCAVPLRAALPWHVAPLRMAPSVRPSPCVHPCPFCASGMHEKGRAGVVGHANGGGERCSPGGGGR